MWWFKKENPALRIAKIIVKGHRLDPGRSSIDAFILQRAAEVVNGGVSKEQGQLDMMAAHRLRDALPFESLGISKLDYDIHVSGSIVEVNLVPTQQTQTYLLHPDIPPDDGMRLMVASNLASELLVIVQSLDVAGETYQKLEYAENAAAPTEDSGTVGYIFGVDLRDMRVLLMINRVPALADQSLMNRIFAEEEPDEAAVGQNIGQDEASSPPED